VADSESHTITRMEHGAGEVTTLAGKADDGGRTAGVGPDARFREPIGIASSGATFWGPEDVATDGKDLCIADQGAIRKLELATGAVTTPWCRT
jgi:hypothetical protein